MSDTALSVTLDPVAMAKLRRTMMARQKVLNEDIRKSVRKATMKVLVSLRASAKIAPPRRSVVEEQKRFTVEERKHSFLVDANIQEWYRVSGSPERRRGKHLPVSQYIPRNMRGGWLWEAIKSRFPQEHTPLPIPGAKTESDAKKSPQAKIQRRKLARSSFTWIMGKLGGASHAEQNEMMGLTTARQYTGRIGQHVTRFGCEFENKVRYILAALKLGPASVNQALVSARNALHGETVNSLKKMKAA